MFRVTKKRTDETDEGVTWSELLASIVANTSLTVRDINDMSYPELEELMDGMSKNADREKDMMNGVQRTNGDANDFINFLANG